jgi:hypothetical protein
MTPVRILGQDDWLFFGRTAEGTLVFTSTDADWHWLESPHGSDCWNEATGLNCDGETKFTCRLDCQYMLNHVIANVDNYDWEECGNDPVSGEYLGWDAAEDAEFVRKSIANYLLKKEN